MGLSPHLHTCTLECPAGLSCCSETHDHNTASVSIMSLYPYSYTPHRDRKWTCKTGLIITALPPLPPYVCCLFSILSVDHHSPISSATQAKTREPSSSTSSIPSKSTCRWSPSLISSPLQSQICSFFPILTTEFRSSSSLLQLCHLL